MTYKRTYTKQEVDELFHWFDTHEYENEINLTPGLKGANVKLLVEQTRYIAQTKYDNPTYSGQIQLVFHLRDELIRQGKVSDKSV